MVPMLDPRNDGRELPTARVILNERRRIGFVTETPDSWYLEVGVMSRFQQKKHSFFSSRTVASIFPCFISKPFNSMSRFMTNISPFAKMSQVFSRSVTFALFFRNYLKLMCHYFQATTMPTAVPFRVIDRPALFPPQRIGPTAST